VVAFGLKKPLVPKSVSCYATISEDMFALKKRYTVAAKEAKAADDKVTITLSFDNARLWH